MKLISCQSRGDRLVKIYDTTITITRPGAFEAAEEWLKGAAERGE